MSLTFLSIGPAKNGTSSVFKMLSKHPRIIQSKTKEPYYSGYIINRNLKSYLNLFNFENIKDEKEYVLMTAELHTKTYIDSDYTKIPNVSQFKFLFLVRNMFDFFLSFLLHSYHKDNLCLIDLAIKRKYFYYKFLKDISNKIGRENILIMNINDVNNNQSEIYKFLNINSNYKFELPKLNPNPYINKIPYLISRNYIKNAINDKCDLLLKLFLDEIYKIEKEFNFKIEL